MSTEVAYEKLVDRLAQRYDDDLLAAAIAVVESKPDAYIEDAIEAARIHVFNDLTAQPEWQRVEAEDISDIAQDIADRAYSQVRAWSGE